MSDFKLYEINELLTDAFDNAPVNEDTGEISEDWANFLDDVQMERDKKCIGVARYIKNLRAEALACKSEAMAMRDRAASKEAAADRLESYLSKNVQEGEKIESPDTVIGWRKSTQTEVLDVYSIPAQYQKVTVEARKKDIKEALKSGIEIVGCKLVNVNNLTIK